MGNTSAVNMWAYEVEQKKLNEQNNENTNFQNKQRRTNE